MRLLALVVLFEGVYAKHEQYIGWKSYIVQPSSMEQHRALGSMVMEYDLDFLSHPYVDREGVVLVKPEYQDGFTKALDDLGVAYRTHVENIKAALDYDDQLIEVRKKESAKKNGAGRMSYDNYQELRVINNYLDDVARHYPETVTLVEPANTFEGRPIKYLKISTTNFEDESKPVIIIDGGIHAREWISPPTVTWAIHKLVENITEPDLLERFDWILLPVVNPDGYEFTFTTTRMWRKTRSTDQHAISWLCPGVDGNRNFDIHWNSVGTDNNPCSDIFAGNQSFSEIEVRAVRDILHEHLHRTALYLTMHSYGSMILYAWGHDGSLSSNAFNLQVVGIAMADAIHEHSIPYFPNYLVGNSVQVIGYPAAGAAEDYAHSIGIPLAYTYELPGLQPGFEGFHLDPRYIQQVCHETWAGIVEGARRAGELYQGVIIPQINEMK